MAFYQVLLLQLKSIQLLQKGRWPHHDHCKDINQYQITTHSVLVTPSSSSLCDSSHERYPPVQIHNMHMDSNKHVTSPPALLLPSFPQRSRKHEEAERANAAHDTQPAPKSKTSTWSPTLSNFGQLHVH